MKEQYEEIQRALVALNANISVISAGICIAQTKLDAIISLMKTIGERSEILDDADKHSA